MYEEETTTLWDLLAIVPNAVYDEMGIIRIIILVFFSCIGLTIVTLAFGFFADMVWGFDIFSIGREKIPRAERDERMNELRRIMRNKLSYSERERKRAERELYRLFYYG